MTALSSGIMENVTYDYHLWLDSPPLRRGPSVSPIELDCSGAHVHSSWPNRDLTVEFLCCRACFLMFSRLPRGCRDFLPLLDLLAPSSEAPPSFIKLKVASTVAWTRDLVRRSDSQSRGLDMAMQCEVEVSVCKIADNLKNKKSYVNVYQ